jgi:hypothetical protein
MNLRRDMPRVVALDFVMLSSLRGRTSWQDRIVSARSVGRAPGRRKVASRARCRAFAACVHGCAADAGDCCKGATWVRFPKTGAARSRYRRVERPDGEFAPRQRTPLIVVDGGEPRDRTRSADAAHALVHDRAHAVAARTPHAHVIDRRRRDAAGERERLGAGVRPGDDPRQRSDVACIRGIVAHRPAQPVAARVLGRARPARGGARPSAPACIGAIGEEPPRSGHAVSWRADADATEDAGGAASVKAASSTSPTARRNLVAKLAR